MIKEGCITMSNKELSKLKIMQELESKKFKQKEAAKSLNLSVRQIRRLFKQYKIDGAKGLVSKKRGKSGNHKLSEDVKNKVYELMLKNYVDFGPTFAHEKLTKVHNLSLSITSVRNIMIEHEIWSPKAMKKRRAYQLRERRSCIGELIQGDCSPHDWFEGRRPKCDLLSLIDDATSTIMELRFVEAETTKSYMQAMKSYLYKHGRPLAFYSDRHSIFRINKPSFRENQLTQFGRALQELDIKLICANSPQAKGRVERAFNTLQDRLPKELRLLNISTIEEANEYLNSFVKEYNSKFSKVPKNPINAHMSVNNFDLDKIFTVKNTRYLSKNLTLQYNNAIYQIKTDRPGYALRKAAVTIIEDYDGNISIEYKGRELKYTVYHEQPFQGEVIPSKLLNYTIDKINNKYKPSNKHPWKRGHVRQQQACI